MKEKKPQKQLLQLVMLTLLSVVSVLVMANESFAALQCYSCHGNGTNDALPLDTTPGSPVSYRNITTGAIKGSHQTHLNGLNITATNQSMCSRCHNNSNYTSSHRSGTITLNKSINASPAATGYNGAGMSDAGTYVFKNQTSVPTLGSCSSVNCHFEKVTPTWGADPATANCDTCHSSSPVTGSHALHLGATHAPFTCGSCHASRTTFQHATSAGNAGRNIDLSPIGGATNYTGSNFQYLPSQSATRQFGQCDNIYCHSSGQGNGGTTAVIYAQSPPIWGNANTSGCGTCHDVNLINTGGHAKHVALNDNCGNCHTGASSATMTSATHVDGLINVDGSSTVGYSQGLSSARGNGYGTCATAACHANPTAAGSVATPTWGLTAANCTACHTGANAITAQGPANGSHVKHATAGSLCTDCHNAGTSATTMPIAGHTDGDIDVLAGYPVNKVKGSAYATCATAACHANPIGTGSVATPTWGVTAASCTACHTGANAITAQGPANGSHVKHATAGSLCTDCHNAGTSATTMPTTGHLDGNIDALQGYPVNKVKGSAYTTCATATCHANPVGTGSAVTPTWGVTAANCTACHTGANAITAQGPANGSHVKHATAGSLCTDCHNAGTTATTMPTTGHLDGNIDALQGYPVNKVKGSAYTTCATATCHANPVGTGSAVTPTWGVTAANCTACHTGANAITAQGPANGSHVKHATAGSVCTDCHNAGTTATTMPTTGHLDGNIDALQGYPVNKVKGSAYTTCATATCHANPVGTGSAVTPAWGVTAANCTACHTGANAITAQGPANGSHVKHAAKGTVCTACHAAGTTATTMPTTGHLDGNIDVTAGNYAANKVKGSAYTTCSNISCHNGPASNPFTAPAIVWGAASSCTNCHAYPPANANHTGVTGNCNSCHNDVAADGITISVPTMHLDGVVQGGKCDSCHGYPPVQSMVGLGTNANYSSAKLQNYSGGGGVHSVPGHLALNLKASQNLGFAGCLTCHPQGSHNQGGAAGFLTANVQVVVNPEFKFDKNRPIVYNAKQSGTGKTSGTCANVACHFQKTPLWSSQPYTQGH